MSLSSGGAQGNADSGLWTESAPCSADGRYVVFSSEASNLVPGDTNGCQDVFIRDRETGTTERVSLSNAGAQAAAASRAPSISHDGHLVTFGSGARSLVAGDSNREWDVFLRDLRAGTTTRISVSTSGDQADEISYAGSLSGDGTVVAFASDDGTLVSPPESDDGTSVYLRKPGASATELLFRHPAFYDDAWGVTQPSLSRDGGIVAWVFSQYESWGGSEWYTEEVRVWDASTGSTAKVHELTSDYEVRTPPGLSADGRVLAVISQDRLGVSTHPFGSGVRWLPYSGCRDRASVSGDGRFVAFASSAPGIVAGDTNDATDVFVHDRRTGAVARVSVSEIGRQADRGGRTPHISADGRVVTFVSAATDLVPGDTNGASDVFVAANPLAGPPLTLSWLNTPGYWQRGVHPLEGEAGDLFTFQVKLTDPDGDEPKYVRVVLTEDDGQPVKRVALVPQGGSTVDGRIYSATVPLSKARNFWHRFEAEDEDGIAVGNPTQLRMGPFMPARPYLVWQGGPGFEQDGWEPKPGPGGRTYYHFRVIYRSHWYTEPTRVRLVLVRDGMHFRSYSMNRVSQTTSRDGIEYHLRRRPLPPGQYFYRFAATNSYGKAQGVASLWQFGPDIPTSSTTAVAVSSLAATLTNAGAQFAFTLSAAARVHARVLNIAGRPVKTLCADRDLEPGVNTLLWNATNDQGLRVPSGMYVVEVSAMSEDGTQARAVGPVRLER